MITKVRKSDICNSARIDYEIGDTVSVKISNAAVISIDDGVYKLYLPNTEREQFVETAIDRLCHGNQDATDGLFEAMYDAGARFK
jgi:hypothetical protein